MQKFLSIVLLSLFISGCSTSTSTPWYMDQPTLRIQYAAAVADATIAEESEICRTLPTITAPGDDDRLEWTLERDTQLILVASLMSVADAQLWNSDKSFELSSAQGVNAMPWVTLPYDLRQHASTFHCTDSLELNMRMVQLLGLPPDSESSYMVFFYADRNGIFRPTPDYEIDDREASLNFPSSTPLEHRKWMEEYQEFAYKSSTPYPWTRLGYTYDWSADNKSHIGPGEFVVKTGSRVRVKAKLSAWQWYQQNKAKNRGKARLQTHIEPQVNTIKPKE